MKQFVFLNDKQKLEEFCRNNKIAFLGLFGSHARGEAGPGSDLDLLVDFAQPVSYFDLLGVEEELTRRLHVSVDLLTRNAVSPYVKPYIERDLVTLYERSKRLS